MRFRIAVEETKVEEFVVRKVLCAGYAARNKEMVMRHIEELKSLGVPPPPKVPTVYEVPPNLLTKEDRITVNGEKTSGEVEYVLFITSKGFYVTVGSDHTDRELERTDVGASKRACPKIVAKYAWSYGELKDHWDDLIIRSYVRVGGNEVLYQEERLSSLLKPEDLMKELGVKEVDEGVVIFSGTVPLKTKVVYSDFFRMELEDPILGRAIKHSYGVVKK
jgi:hypothetical protein